MKDLLFQLFGEGELVAGNYDCWHYTNDDFRIEILEKNGSWLVSVDLHSTFNKVTQCPIHFIYHENEKFSRRKMKRIQQALRFLIQNKKEAGGFFGHMNGFDDVSSDILREYYRDYY